MTNENIKANAIRAYKMGLAVFNGNNEEIQSVCEITDDDNYRLVVGENQFSYAQELIHKHLKEINYIPIEVTIDEVARQMATHYAACFEGNLVKDLLFDTAKESIERFLTICEPICNYDCEL